MTRRKDDQKREAVAEAVALVKGGQSTNKATAAIGKKCGVTGRTLQRWAAELDQPLGDLSSYDIPQKAIEAHQNQAQERRERIRLHLLEKMEDLLGRMDEPHVDFKGKDAGKVTYPIATSGDVRNYATSFGILLDKYRLEMGEATTRGEISVNDAVQVVRDEVAQMREKRATR